MALYKELFNMQPRVRLEDYAARASKTASLV